VALAGKASASHAAAARMKIRTNSQRCPIERSVIDMAA